MAEKHKSKYKKPENTKYKSRKDLKDYTMDDKDGKLNPYSTKEKLSNVLRKTDKTVQDDGNYDVKYNSDDRLYKDLEDGEYDAKHAAKILKKRQDNEEKETSAVLKDKVENLTREQKERLVREYVRRTIVKQLIEQEDKETEEPDPNAAPPADPNAAPPADPNAAPAPDLAAPDPNAAPPAASTPAAPTTPTPDETTASPEDKAKEKIAKQKIALKYWEEMLSDQTGPNSLVDTGFDPLAKALGNLDVKDLKLAKIMILRRLAKIKPAQPSNDETEK
ncbi:hypothetical protein UFOVP723_179 [uncultured Caudovirales phage]|uniref:Uncharacterized protein n=1 Tax=uncultured Caudovirales phage TaxID=2100421 RepID=A0A6J5NYY0_9CAUD|nr:hypothetical protein UFOVP723_179 [uncultured Caudovirales phage]